MILISKETSAGPVQFVFGGPPRCGNRWVIKSLLDSRCFMSKFAFVHVHDPDRIIEPWNRNADGRKYNPQPIPWKGGIQGFTIARQPADWLTSVYYSASELGEATNCDEFNRILALRRNCQSVEEFASKYIHTGGGLIDRMFQRYQIPGMTILPFEDLESVVTSHVNSLGIRFRPFFDDDLETGKIGQVEKFSMPPELVMKIDQIK